MKLCRFDHARIGVVDGDLVRDVSDLFAYEAAWPLPHGDIVARQMASRLPLVRERFAEAPSRPLAEVRLESPIANPEKIIGAPINYRKHIDEANADPKINYGKTFTNLEQYGLFIKATSALIGPSDVVRPRFPDRRTDHEVELAVVIGREARFVRPENALQHVLGYAIGLDMTVRGPEFPGFRKSVDTYAVLGPWIVTADEIPDPGALDLSIRINGVEKQRSNTAYLLMGVPELIAYASKFYTLHPGDVIMTGTPEGVSPVGPGDVMEAEIERIGAMRVELASEWAEPTRQAETV